MLSGKRKIPDTETALYRTGPISLDTWRTRLIWVLACLFLSLFPFAFINRGIYIDEAWIGEQVHSLIHQGIVTTSFFRDYPPLDQTVVIYHKLLVWLGSLAALLFG